MALFANVFCFGMADLEILQKAVNAEAGKSAITVELPLFS
jgi:hypothetical protein